MTWLKVALAGIAALTGYAGVASGAGQGGATATMSKPWLIAHRGASAYAPENTVPAFRLAADQHAAFVEFDLQLTKDRQIVCLHDESLERTTDVEDVFPDRFRTVTGSGGAPTRRWLLADFTLAELRTLDAGSWFGPSFRGTRIPTFAETIDSLRGRSGLFIELKAPEKYARHRADDPRGTESQGTRSARRRSADSGAAPVVHGLEPSDPGGHGDETPGAFPGEREGRANSGSPLRA